MPIHPNTRRCTHIKLNQKQCGAPALTGETYCRFHGDLTHRRREVPVPVLQTAADIQLAITDTIRALIEGRIDRLRAGTILFGLQLAQNGLRIVPGAQIRFTGDLEGINPAERSVVMPALDDRQAQDEYEAEQERELELADTENELCAPPLSDREEAGSGTPSPSRSSRLNATDRVGTTSTRDQKLSPEKMTHNMGTVDEEELERMVMELTQTAKAG